MADAALQIANLKARYCAAADLFPSDPVTARRELLDCLTSDFSGDYGVAQFSGPEQIADFLQTAVGGGSEWMVHHLTSPRIVVEGASAVGDWAIVVHSKRRDSGERMEVVGRYSDRFQMTEGGWRIAAIRFQQMT
jgi:hypothetical protein